MLILFRHVEGQRVMPRLKPLSSTNTKREGPSFMISAKHAEGSYSLAIRVAFSGNIHSLNSAAYTNRVHVHAVLIYPL